VTGYFDTRERLVAAVAYARGWAAGFGAGQAEMAGRIQAILNDHVQEPGPGGVGAPARRATTERS
jgi:hypothetical protein